MTTNLPIHDQSLLKRALTHRSFLNENESAQKHNERLEFLGDAVLELTVSEYLFEKFPEKPEGTLTAYRAALVRTTTLAEVAATLELGQKLRLSKGEELTGGRQNPSLLANTFEAVMGAIYLDQDYQAAKAFVAKHLLPKLNTIIEKGLFKDFKSTLQEHVQAEGHDSPEYQVIDEEGPDHNKQFTINVKVDGEIMGQGSGKSKQSAQQAAARDALEKLGLV